MPGAELPSPARRGKAGGEMMLRALAPIVALAAALLGLSAGPAAAWPDKPVHVVVPFPAGGPDDVVARIIAPKLAQRLGQPVVVENREGRDGIAGSAFVAAAAPDGYTLLLTPASHVLHPATYTSLPFDTETAFAPVSLLLQAQYVLVVNPSLPVEALAGLVDYAKSHPGQLHYASAGRGGPSQLAFALFEIASGTNFIHAAYNGGVAAIHAVVVNQAQAMMVPLVSAVPLIEDGDLNGLAVSGKHPSPALPNLPTIADSLPGYSAYAWFGVLAPAGTPAAVVDQLSEALDAIVHEPDVAAKFAKIGGEPVGGPPGLLGALIAEEIPKWKRVAKEAGIRIE
jgi:tripartite-type tricarboxylate transporter receptor subunit TctC